MWDVDVVEKKKRKDEDENDAEFGNFISWNDVMLKNSPKIAAAAVDQLRVFFCWKIIFGKKKRRETWASLGAQT